MKVTLAQLKVRGHTADRRTREVAGERFSPIPIRLVEAGRLGRKTGQGVVVMATLSAANFTCYKLFIILCLYCWRHLFGNLLM